MKQRIALDMDGVLADVMEQFFRYDEIDFGRRRTFDEAVGKPEADVFPKLREYVFTRNFFRSAPVMKGSKEVLPEIIKKYDVFIVSAATEFPQSLSEKQEWLNEHFPFIQWQHIVFCGLKTIIDTDIMIDDHFKNLDYFKRTTLLFSQPHNLMKNEGRHKRVNSWEEIAKILL
jgi:5'(3')-deoxyribonucleotidase